jgi:hypothetical protein
MKRRIFGWLYAHARTWQLRAFVGLVYGLQELGGWSDVAGFFVNACKQGRKHARRNQDKTLS